jgi:hypothetical protein
LKSMNRSVIKLATAGLFFTALGLGTFVWHTRYRILPLEADGPREHRLRTHLSSDQFCLSAMKATEQRYLRPVFTLTGTVGDERIAFGLRKVRIDWAELPKIFDSFRTQSERTIFVVAKREQNSEKDRFTDIARRSPYVDNLCLIDPNDLPDWFPRLPEPRGLM